MSRDRIDVAVDKVIGETPITEQEERSEQDYWRTVSSIAKEAVEEYPDPSNADEREEYITQSVDGNEYIIYYYANEIVLSATSNEPDEREVASMSDPEGGWRAQRTLAAYMAMEQDVREALSDLEAGMEDEEDEDEDEQPGATLIPPE